LNLMDWARWMEAEAAARTVARTDIDEGVRVSTVFLGIDHSFGRGGPVLFETMVFGGEYDQEMERYRT